MNTLATATHTHYATGYAEGRHAARDHIAGFANPYQRNSPAYQGWSDGHYDERSARSLQIHRHSLGVDERPN